MITEQYPGVYLYQRIVHAKLFIDHHFDEPIDVDNISGEACFSKFHFIRLFKKIYGKTPHQYLTAVRLAKAVILLKAGKPVMEVCNAVGFESASSFGKLFKRTIGMSPSAFLEAQHQLKKQFLTTPLKFVPGCFAYQHGWSKK